MKNAFSVFILLAGLGLVVLAHGKSPKSQLWTRLANGRMVHFKPGTAEEMPTSTPTSTVTRTPVPGITETPAIAP